MREDLVARLEESRRTTQAQVEAAEQLMLALQESRRRWAEGRSEREVLHDSVVARLQARLASQPVIEQAKGIIMCRSGCSADEAFDLLRRASQRSNVPVRVLAERVVRATVREPKDR